MEHGDDGNIPGRCHIIASHLLQKTGNHAGHTEAMIHQPVTELIALLRRDDLPEQLLYLARLLHIVHKTDEIAVCSECPSQSQAF